MRLRIVLAGLFATALLQGAVPAQEQPRTVAETSDFTRTGTHADVMAFCEALDAASDRVRLETLGTSTEGKPIPVLWVGEPAPTDAAAARKEKKLVALLIGNIHAGEVCGKEALQMLAREIALAEERGTPIAKDGDLGPHPLLKDYVIAFVPIYNADGNDKMGPDNRPGQVGPEEMGERVNGQGLDLNRDFVKMEAPETRALAKLVRDWDPDIIVDTHTTNGSYHRYTLTYAGPMNPAGDAKVIEYVRDTLLATVTKELEAEKGWGTYFYGNFTRDGERWVTYSSEPRYATQYRGLRNRVAILSEAYSYAPYKDRVMATHDFVAKVLEYGAAHKDEIRKLVAEADERTIKAGQKTTPDDDVPVRTQMTVTWEDVPLRGYKMEEVEGERPRPTEEPEDRVVDVMTSFEASQSVKRPSAYLVPARLAGVVENLKRHGIEVRELREDVELDVEVYRIDEVSRSEREFQGHRLVSVEATPMPGARRVAAGTLVVPTGQKLGDLAVWLLEPLSEDGLVTWGFFDDDVEAGADFPVWRMASDVPLVTTPARALDEDREFGKRVTYDVLYEGGERPDFGGGGVGRLSWDEDGEHYEQSIGGSRMRVHAPTGRRERIDEDADLAPALAALAWIGDEDARQLARRARFDDGHTGAIVTHEDDIYWVAADGSAARRLTATAGEEEMRTFSPDGQFVAFVRDFNLWVVDVATGRESSLTRGGHDTLRYAKHDWVYFEELYGRRWGAFWWSPDSTQLMLFETDSSMMDDFTVINDVPPDQSIETVRYPNPGERNPQARVGLVSAGGGDIRWVDLTGYDDGAYLVSRVGFTPDSRQVWLCVQNKAQTWLDLLVAPVRGGKPTRLFRDQTEAWIEPVGDPAWLEDGSFLWLSERSGWQHVYHYDAKGKLLGQITDGDYEVDGIVRVDEDAGLLWFRGSKDSPVADNLYRVSLKGGTVERLTNERGYHSVSVSPTGAYFVDSWSSFEQPTKVALRNAKGGFVRWIDTNPVYELEEWTLGRREIVTIPGAEGQPEIEATITYPPDFDESKTYPVWFMTYGGPHAPTVRDSWGNGGTWDQVLAEAGIIAFHADPYSASGKGAQATWTAYKQLGLPELRDIEHAIRWLTANDWADGSRVGMDGHSYGGFMTAYCLTHSKLFSAGIAGAPVTDWRLYDTIYTERYMDTPQENPEGYEKTSVVGAAKDLHGELLLLHGTIDDNVHIQNTIRLVDALQREGKTNFQMFVYPGFRHGIFGTHYRKTMWSFIERTMGVADRDAGEDDEPAPDSMAEDVGNVSGP
jgi:dipeptidyl aminopeptidase/acylaminoacyl peptidase